MLITTLYQFLENLSDHHLKILQDVLSLDKEVKDLKFYFLLVSHLPIYELP